MISVVSGFFEFGTSLGFVLPKMVQSDSKITRFDLKTGKLGKQYSGWCIQFEDGKGGVLGDWSTGEKHHWQVNNAEWLPPDEYKKLQLEQDAKARRAQAEKEQATAKAVELAKVKYEKAATVSSNGFRLSYLLRKCLSEHSYTVKLDEEHNLLLPLCDLVTGELRTLQTIHYDGSKLFEKGISNKGYGLLLSGNDTTKAITLSEIDSRVVCICEGFATGATIQQATGLPVVVAFSGGNLKPVAERMVKCLPDALIVVCGDNDTSKNPNRGAVYAQQVADAVGGVCVLASGINGTDFNDDFVNASAGDVGLAVVKDAIDSAIKRHNTKHVKPIMCDLMDSAPGHLSLPANTKAKLMLVCEKSADAVALGVQIDSRFLQFEPEPNMLALKAQVISIRLTGKLGKETDMPTYWLALGHSSEWVQSARANQMQSLDARELLVTIDNHGLKAVISKINAALPKQVQTLAMNPKFNDTDRQGNPKNTLDNWKTLCRWEGVTLRRNNMTRLVEFRAPWVTCDKGSDIEETINFTTLASLGIKADLSERLLNDYVATLSTENAYHPVVDWIVSDSWDGVSRLADFANTLITDETAISSKLKVELITRWAIGAVQVLFTNKPSELHGVLTLQGKQGQGKMKWIDKLCPVAESIKTGAELNTKRVDSVRQVTGTWITEFGELEATFSKSGIASLKAFITQKVDEYRIPFAKNSNKQPRRTAFIATVNETHYLVDDTGNRRFWTIPVSGMDYQHNVNMQQFWAEILVYFKEGYEWWLSMDMLNELNGHNEQFEASDPYQEAIMKAFNFAQEDSYTRPMTASEVCEMSGYASPDRRTSAAIGKSLIRMGLKQDRRRVSGISGRYYLMPEPNLNKSHRT